jgi:hypothetical protein
MLHKQMVLATFAVTIVFFLVASACERSPDWTGHIYPDRTNLTESQLVGYFDSLESCREATTKRLASFGAMERGDYECGYRCKPFESGSDLLVCERTER